MQSLQPFTGSYICYLYWYLLPEGYSEEDIVLDENGGRNIFEKMFFLPKVVDLLKVEFNLLLEEKKKSMMSIVVIVSSCISPLHVLTH